MDNLPTMDTLFAPYLYMLSIHFYLRRRGQPLNNRQNACPKRVHYSEVPLYYTADLSSVLLLKLEEISPGVSEVRVDLDGPLEPFPPLTYLPLRPEQPVSEGEGEGAVMMQ